MNKEHQDILEKLRKHFKETSAEELERKSEEFYNPYGNEVTVNEYFGNFAGNHRFLEELQQMIKTEEGREDLMMLIELSTTNTKEVSSYEEFMKKIKS